MVVTEADEESFEKATLCSVCSTSVADWKDKARDHCRRTGKHRGAARACCSINYYSNRLLPVCFHIVRGYDNHLVVERAVEVVQGKEKNDAIPNCGETYDLFKW